MATQVTDRNEAVRKEIASALGRVPAWVEALPDQMVPGFWATMRDFQLAETTIPNKYKELIGLAVAAATRCKYCTLFHTEAARLFGASDLEISEACAMAAHTMAASTFVNGIQVDYEQFKEETLGIIAYAKSLPKGKASSRAEPELRSGVSH